jgi:hypothetical protein
MGRQVCLTMPELVNEIVEIHNGGIKVVVFPQMKFTFYMAISS